MKTPRATGSREKEVHIKIFRPATTGLTWTSLSLSQSLRTKEARLSPKQIFFRMALAVIQQTDGHADLLRGEMFRIL